MLAGLLCRGGASWPPYITTAWPSAFLAWPGRSPSSVRATPGMWPARDSASLPGVWHPAAAEAAGVLIASPGRRRQASGQGCG